MVRVVVRWCVTGVARKKGTILMPVAVGDIVRITARMLLDGVSDVVNVFHFDVAVQLAVDDDAFMVDVAAELDLLYITINGHMSARVSYTTIDGQNITKNELLPSKPWPSLTVGGAGSDMLPEPVSACVFHRTLTPRVRAAKFLPPFTIGSNIGGALTALAVTAVTGFGAILTSGMATPLIQIDYIAFNRILGTGTPITQHIVPSRFRTQRRRRLGVGS